MKNVCCVLHYISGHLKKKKRPPVYECGILFFCIHDTKCQKLARSAHVANRKKGSLNSGNTNGSSHFHLLKKNPDNYFVFE